jgi:hypothetical protein
MGADIKGEDVLQILSHANEQALRREGKLPEKSRQYWLDVLDVLSLDKTPRTYIAVFTVVLVARSLHSKEFLDVLQIKKGKHPLGYSAPSIGTKVATFAKEQNIDLRATSSQPMNNQPFTFMDSIEPDMGVQAKFSKVWDLFYQALVNVNDLNSLEAQGILSVVFEQRRRVEKPKSVLVLQTQGTEALEILSKRLCEFVDSNSDSGKVGQAFVSAVYSLIYDTQSVQQGDSQDPDAKTPGDVHVVSENQWPWLWMEVKQKAIATGDIKGFVKKVTDLGGDNIAYFALKNSKYSSHIQESSAISDAIKKGARLVIYQSPGDALSTLLPYGRGLAHQVAENLANQMLERLIEANASAEIISNYKSAVAGLVEFTSLAD